MIDPLEKHLAVVVTRFGAPFTQPALQGSFTAPEDLTLREVRLTACDLGAAAYTMVVTTDPDLTILQSPEISTAFQLIAFLDPFTLKVPVTEIFQNLSFPLLKGQTLYLGGANSDNFQLIFN